LAILQISRITNRKGLQINLPQLAGAELGWSIDERRLFIGNGTLAEGAPAIGNTEILTEFSDIFAFQTNYTYKGEAAGYTVQTGVTPSSPVTQSLQSWLDQFATVKDFGAVGDGVTDDTEAINRALYQLYCRETNTQIRRSLFFPAGVYRVTQTILIPPFATLYGEGPDASLIQLDNSTDDSTLNAYVARTADSLQQYGANIGTNSATPPEYITITNLGFVNQDVNSDIFLVEDATNCRFQNVGFFGPLIQSDLTTDSDDTAGVRFASTASLITSQIVFENCYFSGTTYGLNTATGLGGSDQQVEAITVKDSWFNTLYQGVVIGTEPPVSGGATGFRVVHSMFDSIYAEGIIIGDVSLNGTAYNTFYDVGDHFLGVADPYTACIAIQSANNVSIGDMFERSDAASGAINPGTSYPRVTLNNQASIAMINGSEIRMGSFVRQTGETTTLDDNTTGTIFTVDTSLVKAFSFNYTMLRDTSIRTGVVTVVANADDSSGELNFSDDYVENILNGISLTVTQAGSTITVSYTASSSGYDTAMTYSIAHLA
jgi:hypothetical protein